MTQTRPTMRCANGGGPSRLQSPRLVAAVTERQASSAHMKTSARKWLGGVLLGTSLVTAAVLIVAGTQLFPLECSDTHFFAGGSVTTQVWTVHWSLIALAVTSILGIILLVVPKREKTNA